MLPKMVILNDPMIPRIFPSVPGSLDRLEYFALLPKAPASGKRDGRISQLECARIEAGVKRRSCNLVFDTLQGNSWKQRLDAKDFDTWQEKN